MSTIAQALGLGCLTGLLSAPHCSAMCGPIAATVCRGPAIGLSRTRYQLGRSVSYVALGSMSGQLGAAIHPVALPSFVLPLCTALGLLWLSLRLLRVPASERPVALRTRASTWASSRARNLLEPALVGALSALLPCGVLATAVLMAAATGGALLGGALMAGFVTTSALAVLGAGLLLRRIQCVNDGRWKRGVAALLIAAATLLLAHPWMTARDRGASVDTATAVGRCH